MLDNLPDVLTVKDLMSFLSISRSKAYELMRTDIPVIKLGKNVRVLKADLIAWLEDKKVS